MGDNTLHLNKDEDDKSPAQMEDVVAEALDDVLGGEPTEQEEGGTNEPAPAQDDATDEQPDEAVDGEAAAVDEGEPPADEAAEGAAGEVDAPDYTIPEGLNERSTERFSKLVEDNKAQRELVSRHEETLNGMRTMVQESGLTNQEYIGAIDFAATVKRDPAEGIKMMQNYIRHIAKTTGIEPEGMEVDMLDDFPDLKEQVEDMELTKKAALELAQARRARQATEQATQSAAQERAQAQQYSQAQEAAVDQLATYLTDMQKRDIDWEAKAPLVLEAAKFARNELHPSRWVDHIKSEVNKINRIAGTVKGKSRTEVPLTGGNAPRGGHKEPQTIEEALDQLL